ncbi:MAG: hypothetical protein AAF846_03840 [Chloroflexota bacterium]
MITYNKRKNSDKRYMQYLDIAVITLIICLFVALNIKISEVASNGYDMFTDASPSIIDVSGEWVGTMTEDYGADVRYDYRIVFDQSQTELQGFTFQEATNYTTDIYAESDIAGLISDTEIFFYEEATLVLDNLSLDNWCRIAVTLNYQVIDGQETLIGTWVGAEDRTGCNTIEGRVVLTRETD